MTNVKVSKGGLLPWDIYLRSDPREGGGGRGATIWGRARLSLSKTLLESLGEYK